MNIIEITKVYHKFFNNICKSFQEGAVPLKILNEEGELVNNNLPYLTYQLNITDNIDTVNTRINIYSRSNSFKEVLTIAEKLEKEVGNGVSLDTENGAIIFHKGSPFLQTLNDPNEIDLKRVVINLDTQIYY